MVKHTCGGAKQMQYGSYFFYGFKGTSFSLLILLELTTCQMHFNLVHFVWNPLAQYLVVGSFNLEQIVLKMQTRVVFNIAKIRCGVLATREVGRGPRKYYTGSMLKFITWVIKKAFMSFFGSFVFEINSHMQDALIH